MGADFLIDSNKNPRLDRVRKLSEVQVFSFRNILILVPDSPLTLLSVKEERDKGIFRIICRTKVELGDNRKTKPKSTLSKRV
ncbi:hypothetical protein AXI59_16715 [Bacillus nakamurai]|uniref:Uncharacterized protein n=1 Tax=Bacillus nakamurai TaxID=1793963 RepID=A0A150F8X6_9BACI|nr:hypothetical protein AXI59_16715 [Bacillus nakamurai]KXZ21644.1 hypothetical protein AXI58_11850 [Bacillus nakamurai]